MHLNLINLIQFRTMKTLYLQKTKKILFFFVMTVCGKKSEDIFIYINQSFNLINYSCFLLLSLISTLFVLEVVVVVVGCVVSGIKFKFSSIPTKYVGISPRPLT